MRNIQYLGAVVVCWPMLWPTLRPRAVIVETPAVVVQSPAIVARTRVVQRPMRTKVVTRYRTETRRICNRGVCRFIQVQVPYQVAVPIQVEEKAE